MSGTNDIGGEDQPSEIHVTVTIQNRYTFDSEAVTGRRIKERANIPAGFALLRRVKGGNEPIPDGASVRLRNGDHFFARPLPNIS